MNILAHLYLSGSSDQVMFGNFIADFVNGEEAESCQKEVYLGILLHREIDHFTDRHSQVALSKKKLWQRHRHYSRVIVDIFYDHFLAKNWNDFSNISLENFAKHAYSIIRKNEDQLPHKAQRVLPHMIANNWLVNYRKLEGINRAMQGMARRASFPSEMAGAIDDLQKDYANFEKDFKIFFPQLASHTHAYLQKISENGISPKKQ